MSYYSESQKPRSEKITLVTAESVERLKLFAADGSDWVKNVDYFVVAVKDAGILIDEWSFSPKEKTLTIIGGADPKTRDLSVIYRHFYSSSPINLPYDLEDGEVVEWEARVLSIGSIGQQLDDENTGIVLESSSSVNLENTDGHFDSFFDTHIWENQNIKFYSWFPTIPISEKIQLFEGLIEAKSFTDRNITFRVKDFVFRLKNKLTQSTYGQLAPSSPILPALVNAPSLRIYGQADNVPCVSFNAQLGGIDFGTISGSFGSTTLTLAGASALGYLSPGDELFFTVSEIGYKTAVEAVPSDTTITVSKPLEASVPAGTVLYVKTLRPSRFNNRNWFICGHKLRERTVEILIVISGNTFLVDSIDEINAGDEVVLNGISTSIRRAYDNKIVLSTNVSASAGDVIEKRPIKKVFLKTNEIQYIRDYSYISTTASSRIELDPLAEFNVAEQRLVGSSMTFTNGSRSITTTAAVDLRSFLKPNDWIRSFSPSRPTWYEIIDVKETEVIVRTNVSVSGGPFTEDAYYKNVDIVDENSLVTVNCLGMERDGVWIRTASDAVRDLVINDAQFSVVNEQTFADAKLDCKYTVSIVEPEQLGASSPLIRDVITKINNSVFGSLYGDSSQSISFSILNSEKPESIFPLRDDDIISFSVDTTQRICNEVVVKYRPFVDIFSGNKTFKEVTFNSGFVDSLIGIKNKIERICYLYNDQDAETIAQRVALFNSMSISTVKLKAKMNLASVLVNDKIYLDLDRLYGRYGGLDQRKLGSVTGVRRDGFNTELSVTDLGNIYNRVASVAPNSTPDYTNATADDKIKWGFVLDDDTQTPDPASEEGLGNFIIG